MELTVFGKASRTPKPWLGAVRRVLVEAGRFRNINAGLNKIKRNLFSFSVLAALTLTDASALGAAPQEANLLPFVSPIFGDNMVLQRGKPNAIWGWSQPGDAVRVEIGENSATATYFFARKVQESVHVPIGLVQEAVGGVPAETFVSAEGLRPAKDFDAGIAELERLRQKGAPEYGNYISHWYDEYDIGSKGGSWADPALDDSSWMTVRIPGGFRELGIGDNRKWYWADARIEGDAVIVSSTSVPDPKAARYAWQSNPAATLFNGAGLPAAPFRTDDWPGITESHPPY
jgi:hypothetical protein